MHTHGGGLAQETKLSPVGSTASEPPKPIPSTSLAARQHHHPSDSTTLVWDPTTPNLHTMYLRSFSLLALGAATASAFRDTSPFFLASTSEYVTTADGVSFYPGRRGILSMNNSN